MTGALVAAGYTQGGMGDGNSSPSTSLPGERMSRPAHAQAGTTFVNRMLPLSCDSTDQARHPTFGPAPLYFK